MTIETHPEEGSGQGRPTHASKELVEHRLNEIEAAAKKTQSDLEKLLDYFEGPTGLWVTIRSLGDRVEALGKDTTNLQNEVKGLNSTRNKIIGGFVVLSIVLSLLVAILRYFPADPPTLKVTLPEGILAPAENSSETD